MVREDKLLLGCQRYIAETLGLAFTQPQPWTMDSILPDTTPLNPTVFILTSGADPTAMLQVSHPSLALPQPASLACTTDEAVIARTAPAS